MAGFSVDKVLDKGKTRSDLTAQRNKGNFVSLLPVLQSNVRSRVEPGSIDLSESMTQLLGSLRDLNLTLKEGFNIIAACSDNWRHFMRTHLTNHDERLSKLAQTLSTMKSSVSTTQSSNSGIQAEQKRINPVIDQQENTISRLSKEVQLSSLRTETVESSVESKMGELEERINEIRESNLNADVPPNVIHSLNDMIIEGALSTVLEFLSQRVEELSLVICSGQFVNDEMRNDIFEIQQRFNSSSLLFGTSSFQPTSEPPNYYPDKERNEIRVSQGEIKAREREIVRKGIERLERQILQYINVHVSKDQIDIALVKKCKTTEIPAVNSTKYGTFRKLCRDMFGSAVWIPSTVTGSENSWIRLRHGVNILRNFTIKLRCIPSIPPREMLRM